MSFKNEEKLMLISEKVDLDWEVRNNTFYIYNFNVDKKQRGKGVGSKIMSKIINFCQLNNITKIIAHIDLTYRENNEYPENKNIHQDPTIKFLKKFNFSVDYAPNKTVKGSRTL